MLNPGLSPRWRWILLATAGAGLIALAVAAFTVAWPYVKYADAEHRVAAQHLDQVSLDGFEYLGEDTADPNQVSRYWIRRAAGQDATWLPQYDSRPLRTDHPGQDSLSRTQYEEELGWFPLDDDRKMPCSLTAYRVLNTRFVGGIRLDDEDEAAIGAGNATLIRVVVACGGG
jgi:hypothetical protein